MSPELLRRARYNYGPIGIYIGRALTRRYNEYGYYEGVTVLGISVIRGMSTLIPGGPPLPEWAL